MSMGEFVWPIRVYWEDTDASGVVYHANYLKWFERARTEWLRYRGHSQERLRTEHGVTFTVANLEIAYMRPARLDDQLEVTTEIGERKRASLVFTQTLRSKLDRSSVLASAEVRVACVNAQSFRPAALPDLNFD